MGSEEQWYYNEECEHLDPTERFCHIGGQEKDGCPSPCRLFVERGGVDG